MGSSFIDIEASAGVAAKVLENADLATALRFGRDDRGGSFIPASRIDDRG